MLLFVASSAVSAIASPNSGLGVYGAPGYYSGFLIACASATIYDMTDSSSLTRIIQQVLPDEI